MSAIETIRKSVTDRSMVRYKKQSLDMFSASAILAVYEKLSPEAQQKYETVMEKNLIGAASIAFKLCR